MTTGLQRAFINNAVPILRKDDRIIGAALGGSYATETMDEFSGLDFVIAVGSEHYDSLIADRVALAEKLGHLLACSPADHIGRPEQLICLYGEPLINVGLAFLTLDMISVRPYDPVILFEKDELLTKEYAKSPAKPTELGLQWFEDRIWIWVHFIAGRIGRGELFDAIEGLSFLRLHILGPMISIRNGRPPRGVRNIETDAPEEARRLALTLCEHNAKSCIRALKAATDLYIYLRGHGATDFQSREEAEKRALNFLSAISDKIE